MIWGRGSFVSGRSRTAAHSGSPRAQGTRRLILTFLIGMTVILSLTVAERAMAVPKSQYRDHLRAYLAEHHRHIRHYSVESILVGCGPEHHTAPRQYLRTCGATIRYVRRVAGLEIGIYHCVSQYRVIWVGWLPGPDKFVKIRYGPVECHS